MNRFSLIIVPPRGASASEVGAPSPRHPRVVPLRFPLDTRRGAPNFICGPPEASKTHFWPFQLPTVFCTCFWRLPGPFWEPFWPHKRHFSMFFLIPWGPFLKSFKLVFGLRVSSEIRSLRAWREKGAHALRPTKPNGFLRFSHVRNAAGRAARKATEHKKQHRNRHPKTKKNIKHVTFWAFRACTPTKM